MQSMSAHQRYQAFMRFQAVDRVPLVEWGPWESTVANWMAETGQPRDHVLAFRGERDPEDLPAIDFSMQPPFQERVVAEDETTVTRIDRMGLTCRQLKRQPETSMPEFVGSPVQTRGDWDRIKRRLDPHTPGRYPADWAQRVARWQERRPILRLYGLVANYYGGPSLFGFARMLLGPERVLYAFYDEPDMVHDMMETATEFSLDMVARALREAPVTLVQFWEDMCYRNGPLISPGLFREFMLPRYKRITRAIRDAGVDILFVDSDGNVAELIPLWLEAGINGVFPMEQAAGNDLHAYRKVYGRDLLMAGGIDKRVLARGPDAIDRELEDKIPLALQGGYVPHVDHSVPPDVPYGHFRYYWDKKKRMLGI